MTSTAARLPPRMTSDEFLAWDGEGHQGKLELVDGVVRAMAPASGIHGMLQANMAYLIRKHLSERGSPCRVGTEVGVAPRIDTRHNLRVPDLTVSCTPNTPKEQAFPDPILIVEILSPSNEKETWESIRACATIPSLMEIVAIAQDSMRAEIFLKDADGAWPQDPEVVEAGGTLRLTTIEALFAMAEIYRGTYLETER